MGNLRGALLGLAGILLGLAPGIRADSLQLKNGSFVQGRYLGGTERSLQFEVNGKIQLYDINQVLSISFAAASADGGVPSNSAEAKPSNRAEFHSVAKKSPELGGTAWGQTNTKSPEIRVEQITRQITWEKERRGSELKPLDRAFGSDCAVIAMNGKPKRRTAPVGARAVKPAASLRAA